jgi:hypothetical protein
MIALLLFAAVVSAKSCEFAVGDVFSGQYRKTLVQPELSGKAVTFTFAPEHTVVETNSVGASFMRWVPAGPNVVVQSLGGVSQCAADAVAKYEVQWSADCQSLSLDVVRDDCQSRTSLYTSMALTKTVVAASTTCSLDAHTQWHGAFPQRQNTAAQFGGERVHFSIAPTGAMVESSAVGAKFYSHTVQGDVMTIRDVNGDCKNAATYKLAFSAACDEVGMTPISDDCASRVERFDQLRIQRLVAPAVKSHASYPLAVEQQ